MSAYRNSPECPLQDILYLIQQEDTESIRNALLEVINNSHPGSELYLYEHGYSLYDVKDRAFSPKLVACLNQNNNCRNKSEEIVISSSDESISFQGFVYLPTEDYVQVFNVEKDRSSRGLLVSKNAEIIDEQYINILISTYNNQIKLLRNKDTDSLTGLYNRQSFDTKLSKLYEDLAYQNRAHDDLNGYVLALLDIDFFKKINDEFGHVYGDDVLILFANTMKKTFRDNDLLFRYGGEEFAVLLNNVSLEQAQSIFDRFLHNIENITLPLGDSVTASIGYCEFTDNVPFTILTQQADKALYYSKEHGRNKTRGYENLILKNKIKQISIDEGDVELF